MVNSSVHKISQTSPGIPKTPRTQGRRGHRIEGMASIPELLDGQEVECLDRLYLNGYVGPLAD